MLGYKRSLSYNTTWEALTYPEDGVRNEFDGVPAILDGERGWLIRRKTLCSTVGQLLYAAILCTGLFSSEKRWATSAIFYCLLRDITDKNTQGNDKFTLTLMGFIDPICSVFAYIKDHHSRMLITTGTRRRLVWLLR